MSHVWLRRGKRRIAYTTGGAVDILLRHKATPFSGKKWLSIAFDEKKQQQVKQIPNNIMIQIKERNTETAWPRKIPPPPPFFDLF